MVDLRGADKGNISLPPRLQTPVIEGQTDDTAKRIQRLQSRNTELEDACVAEKLLRSQTDVETTDQIVQLNRQISGEMEKINDYKKRIQTVQKWIEEEKQMHLDKVEAANEKYDKTRLAITSEIKVLNAKINTLEEYKTSKSDLRNKLIAGNNLIAQRDEEAKQRCEQIERKFKIGREKLKKEMYARLQGLAGTFQTEVAASVAKPMHRLIRENVFLKNELMDIVRESVPKKETIKRNKEADVQILHETTATKKSTVKHLVTSKIQGYLLSAVKEEHKRLKDCLETFKQSESEMAIKAAEITYASKKMQADEALRRISLLETGLHKQNTQLALMNYLKNKSKTELDRCTDVLYDAKYAVACALQMNDTGKDISEMGDEELMSYLLDIFRQGDTEKWRIRIPSLATILPPAEAYKIGDLGFEPSHIEVPSLAKKVSQPRTSKLSTLKILGAFGIELSAVDNTESQTESHETDIGDPSEKSLDSITDDKADASSAEDSASSSSQEGDPVVTTTPFEAVEEEERETDVEGENGGEAKIELEEKPEAEEIANRVDDEDKNGATKNNERSGSQTRVAERSEMSLQGNSSTE